MEKKGWGKVRSGEEVDVGKKRAKASSTTTDISEAATVTNSPSPNTHLVAVSDT